MGLHSPFFFPPFHPILPYGRSCDIPHGTSPAQTLLAEPRLIWGPETSGAMDSTEMLDECAPLKSCGPHRSSDRIIRPIEGNWGQVS